MTAIIDVYVLPHLAAILISGLDAEKFLQSQLSSNVAALVVPGRAAEPALAMSERAAKAALVMPEAKDVQLSSWCAANGRVIGLGWLFRTPEGFCWIVAADTVEAILVGLNKYRLRSKVSLTQAGSVVGIDVDTAAIASESNLISVPLADGRSIGYVTSGNWAAAPEHFLARWQQRDIELKIAWNGGGERFLPQMLGIERFAGLSLKKGCFPGQEVISRLHYKGVLKRSLRVLKFEQPIVIGRFLCSNASDEVEVIQAQGLEALAVVGNHLSRNFSIQRDGLELFCRTCDAEFLAIP